MTHPQPQDQATSTETMHAASQAREGGKPVVVLPGHLQSVPDAASSLGGLLDKTGHYFQRDGKVVRLERRDGEQILCPVKPAELPDAFERVATLKAYRLIQGRPLVEPTTCTKAQADIILHSRSFVEQLSPIRVVCLCPVLAEDDGKLIQIHDYNRELGILAAGRRVPSVELPEARRLLSELVADFDFATPADRSRVKVT